MFWQPKGPFCRIRITKSTNTVLLTYYRMKNQNEHGLRAFYFRFRFHQNMTMPRGEVDK